MPPRLSIGSASLEAAAAAPLAKMHVGKDAKLVLLSVTLLDLPVCTFLRALQPS